jgi:hypothetical protein
MDLQFADSHISEIGRFAIADWAQQFEDLNKICMPTFANLPQVSTVPPVPAANLMALSL